MFDAFQSLPLVKLLRRGSRRFNFDILIFIIVSGLSNAGVLMIINAAAENARNEGANGQLLGMFLVAIVLYISTQRIILFTSIREVERILNGIRVRVADKLRLAELPSVEQAGRSQIFGTVSRETQNISQAAGQLVVAAQAATMVFFTVAYLAMLSWTAFFLTVGLAWLSLTVHFRRSVGLNTLLFEAQQRENDFLGGLTHLLDGFKEVRMNRPRSEDLYAHMRRISTSVEDVKSRAGIGFASHYIFVQVAFYALLASIVFLLPKLDIAAPDVVMKLTAAVLFIIGPLGMIVNSIPVYSTANVAASNIEALERGLDAAASSADGQPDATPPAAFAKLELTRATFLYDERGAGSRFQLGPIDLTITAGEMVFIMGGNGSGKSTLLKTLTGLYQPTSGAVTLDGVLVTPETAGWYRSHISTVFSDYHLFDRLYGFRQTAPERVQQLLSLMQIESKTAFVDGRFTTQELSSGQRKRLALIVALLEDRPILVLDEWAADQDPAFRQFFYDTLLKDLKAQGKTIIAATHDDRYFGVADRVIKMEYGQFTQS